MQRKPDTSLTANFYTQVLTTARIVLVVTAQPFDREELQLFPKSTMSFLIHLIQQFHVIAPEVKMSRFFSALHWHRFEFSWDIYLTLDQAPFRSGCSR